jgi:hypothetical protein
MWLLAAKSVAGASNLSSGYCLACGLAAQQGPRDDFPHPLLNLWHDIDVGVQPPTIRKRSLNLKRGLDWETT